MSEEISSEQSRAYFEAMASEETSEAVAEETAVESEGQETVEESDDSSREDQPGAAEEVEGEDNTAEQVQDESEAVIDEILQPLPSWSKEDKEVFKTLPKEAQQILINQGKNLHRGYQQKFIEASNMHKEFAHMKGFVERFETDQKFAEFVLSYKERTPMDDNFGLGERPNDLAEAYKWDVLYEDRKKSYEETLKTEEVEQVEVVKLTEGKARVESDLAHVRENDEHFEEVSKLMAEAFNSKSKKEQDEIAYQWYNNNQNFRADYETFRNYFINKTKADGDTSNNPGDGTAKSNNPKLGTGKVKRPVAPILEESANSSKVDNQIKIAEKRKEVLKEAKKGNTKSFFELYAEQLG